VAEEDGCVVLLCSKRSNAVGTGGEYVSISEGRHEEMDSLDERLGA
jgi:hypothetical protein